MAMPAWHRCFAEPGIRSRWAQKISPSILIESRLVLPAPLRRVLREDCCGRTATPDRQDRLSADVGHHDALIARNSQPITLQELWPMT